MSEPTTIENGNAGQTLPPAPLFGGGLEQVCLRGSKVIVWEYPEIGTCGKHIDVLRVAICRTRAIQDIIIGFDGERGGWVIAGSFRTVAGDDFEFKEVAFIPEWDEDESPNVRMSD